MVLRLRTATYLLVAQITCASASFDLASENAAALAARIVMRSEQMRGSEDAQEEPTNAQLAETQAVDVQQDAYVGQSTEIGTGYKASPIGSCKHKVGEGMVRMMGKHCRAMGGKIPSTVGHNDWHDCQLDFCKDGNFSAAAVGKCKVKVGYGIVKMEARDCRGVGGAMNGNPGDSVWTDCHMDWCRDGTYSAQDVGQCQVKRAFGKIQMKEGACAAMGGLKEVTTGDSNKFVQCAFDWCYTTDCLYQDWSAWGACSVTCDGGTHVRNRAVLVEAMYGGRLCASHKHARVLLEEKACGQEMICWGSPCEDHPKDWVDKVGDTCNVYEWGELCGHYRTEGPGWHVKGQRVSFADFRGTNDKTAIQACCSCGGGRKPNATVS